MYAPFLVCSTFLLAALCCYPFLAAGLLALPISGMYVLFLGFTLPHLIAAYLLRPTLALLEGFSSP